MATCEPVSSVVIDSSGAMRASATSKPAALQPPPTVRLADLGAEQSTRVACAARPVNPTNFHRRVYRLRCHMTSDRQRVSLSPILYQQLAAKGYQQFAAKGYQFLA